jgi:hypothetical protein
MDAYTFFSLLPLAILMNLSPDTPRIGQGYTYGAMYCIGVCSIQQVSDRVDRVALEHFLDYDSHRTSSYQLKYMYWVLTPRLAVMATPSEGPFLEVEHP